MKTSLFPRLSRSCSRLLLIALGTTAFAVENENPYDQLGATLVPLASIFQPQGEHRALRATLVLEAMTGLPSEQAGGRLELYLEPPHRALLRGSLGGREVTALRSGQSLWLSPAALAALFPTEAPKKKKKGKKEKGLDPLLLPFPPQQLALLPVLFTVREGGRDDQGRRVLAVRLMPELAKSISRSHPEARADEWEARLHLSKGQLSRVELARPGWAVAVRVEQLELSAPLPEETWAPPQEDVVHLKGPEARRWLNGLGRLLDRQAERLK